jgi:excisionase family DNA binding protein
MSTTEQRLPFRDRMSCTVAEACVATGLSKSKLYELMSEGCLRSTTVGRRRLVLMESLLEIVDGGKPHEPLQ